MSDSVAPQGASPEPIGSSQFDVDLSTARMKMHLAKDALERAFESINHPGMQEHEIHYAIEQCAKAFNWVSEARGHLCYAGMDVDAEDEIDTPLVADREPFAQKLLDAASATKGGA